MDKKTSRKIVRIIRECFRPQLDCDGQSRAFSWRLQQEGIEHTVLVGAVAWQGSLFPIHYWITFPDSNYVLDCKLRKWFGETRNVPAGLFEWHYDLDSPLQYLWDGDIDMLAMNQQLFDILMDSKNLSDGGKSDDN